MSCTLLIKLILMLSAMEDLPLFTQFLKTLPVEEICCNCVLLQFSNMIPDFVITGPQYRARGPAGYLCAGFWDSRWDFRPELVSCPYCL